MTMWLSAVKTNNNSVLVRHNQRGYPLKAINKKMIYKEKILRKAFKLSGKSPIIKNIYSEIFSKSLNSLAFNMTAIYFQQTNKRLKFNKKALEMLGMSMLSDFKAGKKVELKLLWDSFKFVLKNTQIKMPYTEKVYNEIKMKYKI